MTESATTSLMSEFSSAGLSARQPYSNSIATWQSDLDPTPPSAAIRLLMKSKCRCNNNVSPYDVRAEETELFAQYQLGEVSFTKIVPLETNLIPQEATAICWSLRPPAKCPRWMIVSSVRKHRLLHVRKNSNRMLRDLYPSKSASGVITSCSKSPATDRPNDPGPELRIFKMPELSRRVSRNPKVYILGPCQCRKVGRHPTFSNRY